MRTRVDPFLILSFLIGFGLALAASRNLGFFWDDWWMIPVLASRLSTGGLSSALGAGFTGQTSAAPGLGSLYGYRPLDWVFLYSLFASFGYNSFPYHIAKSLFHGAFTLVLYVLVKQLVLSRKFALFAAVFYSLTGSAIYSSMWITNFETISEVFLIAGLILFLKYVGSSHTVRDRILLLAGIILMTILGSWFKDTARALPVILIIYSLIFVRSRITRGLVACLAVSLWFAILPAFFPILILTGKVMAIPAGVGSGLSPWILLDNAFHNLIFTGYQLGLTSIVLGVLCLKTCSERIKLLAFPGSWFFASFLPTLVSQAPRLDVVLSPVTAAFAAILVLAYFSLRIKPRKVLRVLVCVLLIYSLLVQASSFVATDQVWGNYWRENGAVQQWAFTSLHNGTVVFWSPVGEDDLPTNNPINSVVFLQNPDAIISGSPPVYVCNPSETERQYILDHASSFVEVYHHSTPGWYMNLDPLHAYLMKAILVDTSRSSICWLKVQSTPSTQAEPPYSLSVYPAYAAVRTPRFSGIQADCDGFAILYGSTPD